MSGKAPGIGPKLDDEFQRRGDVGGGRRTIHEAFRRRGPTAVQVVRCLSDEVSRWLAEYPIAKKYCPKLSEMGLTDPRLLDEALLPDK